MYEIFYFPAITFKICWENKNLQFHWKDASNDKVQEYSPVDKVKGSVKNSQKITGENRYFGKARAFTNTTRPRNKNII